MVIVAGLAVFTAYFIQYIIPSVQEVSLRFKKTPELSPGRTSVDTSLINNKIAAANKRISKLQKQLDKYIPTTAYLVINTNENEFSLYSKGKLIRSGICSTGKYELLEAKQGKWIFKTPRGVRKVLNKQTAPVWTKPDWAFIEEGLPIPPPGHSSRIDKYALGEYKLDLGQGYMVHGTLYQRLLGKPVTHGCVRMGDEDLEEVYATMSVGSNVYIY
jgi:hypothetical protein